MTEPEKKTETESDAAILVNAVTRTKTPILTIGAILVAALTGGGGFSFGLNASSEAKAAYEILTRKVDKLTDELVETRKVLAEDVVRVRAERHEERIRALEEHDRNRERAIERIETLLKAAPK
jgi:uncharacterized protein HemX